MSRRGVCPSIGTKRIPVVHGGVPECPENAQGWEIIRACVCPDKDLGKRPCWAALLPSRCAGAHHVLRLRFERIARARLEHDIGAPPGLIIDQPPLVSAS